MLAHRINVKNGHVKGTVQDVAEHAGARVRRRGGRGVKVLILFISIFQRRNRLSCPSLSPTSSGETHAQHTHAAPPRFPWVHRVAFGAGAGGGAPFGILPLHIKI